MTLLRATCIVVAPFTGQQHPVDMPFAVADCEDDFLRSSNFSNIIREVLPGYVISAGSLKFEPYRDAGADPEPHTILGQGATATHLHD